MASFLLETQKNKMGMGWPSDKILKQVDRSGFYRCKATSQVSWAFLP